MSKAPPSLSRRISLAFGSFFGILSRPDFAADVDRLRTGGASEAPTSLPQPAAPSAAPAPAPAPAVSAPAAAPVAPVAPATPKEADTTAALQLLSLLQREARLVDFVQEDIAAYSDAEIGAAARVVHEGCRKVLRAHFTIAPVRSTASSTPTGSPASNRASQAWPSAVIQYRPPLFGPVPRGA